jgi:hypothetical protein
MSSSSSKTTANWRRAELTRLCSQIDYFGGDGRIAGALEGGLLLVRVFIAVSCVLSTVLRVVDNGL